MSLIIVYLYLIDTNDVHIIIEQSIPILPPSPECTKNDDCASDTTCINQRCVSPCTLGDSCGRGSFCHSQNHQPICRCPNGYTGDPRIACTPRKNSIFKFILNFYILQYIYQFVYFI